MRSGEIVRVAVGAIALSILTACGGSPHPRAVGEAAATNAPTFIELRREVRANTLHFPAGVYTLSSSDKIGYYYRAPRKIMQHGAGSSFPRDGGIFVSKRNQAKLRGYVYLGGAVVHVGNFSHADYAFRSRNSDEDVPAAGPY
jgi:hypothetical protein